MTADGPLNESSQPVNKSFIHSWRTKLRIEISSSVRQQNRIGMSWKNWNLARRPLLYSTQLTRDAPCNLNITGVEIIETLARVNLAVLLTYYWSFTIFLDRSHSAIDRQLADECWGKSMEGVVLVLANTLLFSSQGIYSRSQPVVKNRSNLKKSNLFSAKVIWKFASY